MSSVNSPQNNDNRIYDYSLFPDEGRPEYKRIIRLITAGSSVIDLGCGNGTLLEKLIDQKSITGTGMELSGSGVNICKQKGLNVLQGKIDDTLPFRNDEFDYAICNVTIQMVNFPEKLLSEMKRISRYQIVSFPNFGFYKNRIEMFFGGRMPRKMLFGYQWYSTGHIHQLSIKDFKELAVECGGLRIIRMDTEETNLPIKNKLIKTCPNLFSVLPVFLLQKE